jgi:hypothetical protein
VDVTIGNGINTGRTYCEKRKHNTRNEEEMVIAHKNATTGRHVNQAKNSDVSDLAPLAKNLEWEIVLLC